MAAQDSDVKTPLQTDNTMHAWELTKVDLPRNDATTEILEKFTFFNILYFWPKGLKKALHSHVEVGYLLRLT